MRPPGGGSEPTNAERELRTPNQEPELRTENREPRTTNQEPRLRRRSSVTKEAFAAGFSECCARAASARFGIGQQRRELWCVAHPVELRRVRQGRHRAVALR